MVIKGGTVVQPHVVGNLLDILLYVRVDYLTQISLRPSSDHVYAKIGSNEGNINYQRSVFGIRELKNVFYNGVAIDFTLYVLMNESNVTLSTHGKRNGDTMDRNGIKICSRRSRFRAWFWCSLRFTK